MFLEFLYPLKKYLTIFNIFQYISVRAAYAAVIALLISFIFGPRIIKALRDLKAAQSIRDDGPKSHLKKAGTPTMGGLLIILAIVAAMLLCGDLGNYHTWLLIFATLGFGGLGFADDALKIFKKNSKGLSPMAKIVGQVSISAIIVVVMFINGNEDTTLLYIPFFKLPIIDLSYFYIPFAILILVTSSNAVNLTDGLDGLATGLVMMVGIAFAVLSYLAGRIDYAEYLQIPFVSGAGEMTVFCLALVGACVGFLWYNSHPAEIMMGDTGSLSLGGVLGVLALMIKKEVLLFIIGGVFVIEVVSVIVQVLYYKKTKKRVFRMAPLHHHFELQGWAESKVVIRFWILGGLFAILGLSTLKLQ